MPQAVNRTYRYVGVGQRYIRRLGIVVKSGDTFECPWALEDANYEEVRERMPASPAKEV